MLKRILNAPQVTKDAFEETIFFASFMTGLFIITSLITHIFRTIDIEPFAGLLVDNPVGGPLLVSFMGAMATTAARYILRPLRELVVALNTFNSTLKMVQDESRKDSFNLWESIANIRRDIEALQKRRTR